MTSARPESDTTVTVKSADRALAILEFLAHAPRGQSLNSIHTSLGIPKSSLHGILHTMRRRGWVEMDESETLFRLGVRALLVGTSYIDTDETVMATRDLMDHLAEVTGETIHLARLDGKEVVYLATRESKHHLRLISRVGRRLPAHATALGKALLAELDPAGLTELLGTDLEALTPHTIVDISRLQEDLDATRERGYALDNEENTVGISCIASVLPGPWTTRNAVSISVPTPRLDQERRAELIEALRTAILSVDRFGSIPGLS